MTPGSPAETIRRAAKLMRERAEAASKGPWRSYIEGRDHWGGDSIIGTPDRDPGSGDLYVHVGDGYHGKWEADQDHIAGWHPLVALAVADWLDGAAERAKELDGYKSTAAFPLLLEGFRNPLAVASAYLGETS
jgi:hypothetical protein